MIGGAPKALAPDNLKAGITTPSRYEPGINRTYQDLTDHHGCVALPTRVMRPRDKAKVEVAVQIVERFVSAKLRHRRFFSLCELNAAIRDCVAAINARIMRRVGTSRHEPPERLDRPALNPLLTTPYSYANGSGPRVAPDDHIEIAGHYYSAPAKLIREIVEARVTSTTVEIFHKGQRVASHAFSAVRSRHTTISEHMPSAHRRYAEWTRAVMTKRFLRSTLLAEARSWLGTPWHHQAAVKGVGWIETKRKRVAKFRASRGAESRHGERCD